MRAAENDFEGYSDDNSTGKGRDGAGRRRGRFCEGAGCMQDVARLPFVRVHIGRGQDTCISEQARRTRRTPTASGIDGVKMVGRARGVKTVGRTGGNGTSSLLGLSSFAGAAHAQDANGQWSRRCDDGGARQR